MSEDHLSLQSFRTNKLQKFSDLIRSAQAEELDHSCTMFDVGANETKRKFHRLLAKALDVEEDDLRFFIRNGRMRGSI